jgi:hypothetical protein
MRVSFTASKATYEEVEGALIVGVAAGDATQEYLLFQRSSSEAFDSEEIYIEYKDQSFSGFNVIDSYRLTRDRLEVDLSETLGSLDITGIDVELELDDASYEQLSKGLSQVYR